MATDIDREDDLVRLNAFVDGELSPADRAAVAARLARDAQFAHAHATLARLKACVHGGADGLFIPPVPAHGPWAWRPALGWAATLAVIACFAAITIGDRPPDRTSLPSFTPTATAVARASLPRLDMAGLTLVEVTVNAADTEPTLVASYLGPHGCKLDLRASPTGRHMPAMTGSSRHRWAVDGTAYELVAHGMPDWRFALISEAAERQTRSGRLPRRMEQRLREARGAAPPCAG